jgi:Type II secretion system (T2SS), protein E, N-terminal domain
MSGDLRLPAPQCEVEQAQIAVADPLRLRNYFLRLGATAEIVGTVVTVELTEQQDHETTIGEYLQAWVDVNGIPATIQPFASPAPAAPADAFGGARPRLGDLLIERGFITPEQLAHGLAESRATNQLLGRVLIGMRCLFEDELARSLAAQLALPYVNLRTAGIERGVARMMPASEGLRVGAIPIGFYGGRLRVAFADPSDQAARAAAEKYVGVCEPVVAELSDIDYAWRTIERIASYAGIS